MTKMYKHAQSGKWKSTIWTYYNSCNIVVSKLSIQCAFPYTFGKKIHKPPHKYITKHVYQKLNVKVWRLELKVEGKIDLY
jgi:hypothetical protein